MSKRLVICVALMASLAFTAFAAPVDCRTLRSLQNFIAQNAEGGCFVQDKLFDNFSYAGGGAVGAGNVSVAVVFSELPENDIHGFLFAPMGAPVWVTGFTLGYSIAVDPPNPMINITGAKLQTNLGILANPATAVSTKSNGLVQTAVFGDETEIDTFAPVQMLTSLTEVTMPAGGYLISLEENYNQTLQQVVPEAGTVLLFGSGLGLLLLRRLVRRY